MLHKETIDTTTLELIKNLQSDPYFTDFNLVGGTALSLHIGHRKSIDIDLFTTKDFDSQHYLEYLEEHFDFQMQYQHRNIIKGLINSVFVDLIKHEYPIINPIISEENIRILSKPDIAAMKVNAISGDGTRFKDFIDIYFLLKEYSFEEILKFYNKKYGSRNEFHAIKSLGYFDDIVAEDWPKMIQEKDLTIDKVTSTIIDHLNQYLDGIIKE